MLMLSFVDIHCHALCNVDDGAAGEHEMYEMLRMVYEDGTRKICLTPHYDPRADGCHADAVMSSFALAEAYCREHLPDMTLYLGNELSYRVGCVEALLSGQCRTLADSRYVLVDFFMSPSLSDIRRGISSIANSGYIPIIAHVERYDCLLGKIREIAKLSEEGALIQVNAGSLRLGWLSPVGRTVGRLLSERLVDMIASDGHNTATRPPLLSGAYETVRAKYGEDYADFLFWVNPERVLLGKRVR